jgi:hypothetical protein
MIKSLQQAYKFIFMAGCFEKSAPDLDQDKNSPHLFTQKVFSHDCSEPDSFPEIWIWVTIRIK